MLRRGWKSSRAIGFELWNRRPPARGTEGPQLLPRLGPGHWLRFVNRDTQLKPRPPRPTNWLRFVNRDTQRKPIGFVLRHRPQTFAADHWFRCFISSTESEKQPPPNQLSTEISGQLSPPPVLSLSQGEPKALCLVKPVAYREPDRSFSIEYLPSARRSTFELHGTCVISAVASGLSTSKGPDPAAISHASPARNGTPARTPSPASATNK